MGFLSKVWCPKCDKLTNQSFNRRDRGKWKCPCGETTKHPPPKPPKRSQ